MEGLGHIFTFDPIFSVSMCHLFYGALMNLVKTMVGIAHLPCLGFFTNLLNLYLILVMTYFVSVLFPDCLS